MTAVVWSSFSGRYSDSPRAVYEALLDRGEDVHAHLAVRAGPTRRASPRAWPPPSTAARAGRAALESADLVVSNNHISLDWDKSPGTTYLQTWHGTPLKRIHRDVRGAPAGRLADLDRDVARWDHLLSPNAASTRAAAPAPSVTRARSTRPAYPRNDVLSPPDRAGCAPRYAPSSASATVTPRCLYTPTWRDDLVVRRGAARLRLPARPRRASPPRSAPTTSCCSGCTTW